MALNYSIRHYARPALVALALAALVLAVSCAPVTTTKRPDAVKTKRPDAVKPPPLEEQDKQALQTYSEILEMTVDADRMSILPQMEEKYLQIIREQPDSFLARESYWRLISMSLEDYYPPRLQRAEGYYAEFVKRYPDDRLRMILDDTMVRYYYKHKMWEALLGQTARHAAQYVKTFKLRTPMFVFLYSEAKFNLNDLKEAKKGYRIVLKHFAGSTEGRISRDRLKEISRRQGKE